VTLAAGTRLGAYDVLALLGAGGMGEVYRARDTKLGREVAIKVLPDLFANDPERLARFQREAQVLASLNHPNIAHIQGLEDSGGVRALVMELVEGPTLADRIAEGAIPWAEALPIARQIAEALEAAHEQGIIHSLPYVNLFMAVRSFTTSPALLTRSVASALTKVSPNLTLTFRSLGDQVDDLLALDRLIAMLSGFFGALALLLAGLGLYGVTAYAVTRRRAEIGIRMALGAAPANVVRLVLSRVSILVGTGVLVGAIISLWASQFVAALLYGLEPRDPTTLFAAALVLGAVAALAAWLPASGQRSPIATQ